MVGKDKRMAIIKPNEYLLDTNIWSHILRRSSASLVEKFSALTHKQIFMSAVVRGELEMGFLNGDRAPHRRAALDMFIHASQALSITPDVSVQYAKIRHNLEKAGTPIGPNDMWIAAEAIVRGLIVVTDNVSEFERVQGLNVENWL
jgi:tRNA(fMet)-specific endonuclease VapC